MTAPVLQSITSHVAVAIIKIVYPDPDYHLQRRLDYDDIGIEEQLNMIWKDIDAGLMPGKDGNWYKAIKAIKEKYTE